MKATETRTEFLIKREKKTFFAVTFFYHPRDAEEGALEELGDVEEDGGGQDRQQVFAEASLDRTGVVHRLVVVDGVVDRDVPEKFSHLHSRYQLTCEMYWLTVQLLCI